MSANITAKPLKLKAKALFSNHWKTSARFFQGLEKLKLARRERIGTMGG
jgi:hypothetical protein